MCDEGKGVDGYQYKSGIGMNVMCAFFDKIFHAIGSHAFAPLQASMKRAGV
jgi:hypothetical protein